MSTATAAGPASKAGTAAARQAAATTRRRLAVVGVVIVAALGFLVYKGLTSAIVFFKTASEAVANRAQLGNSTFQLEGTVVRGTVHHLGGSRVAFEIRQGGASIHIVNTGEPPQLFRPGLPVVVVGHFVGSGDNFASDQIMVKHSQQYIAAHPNRVRSTGAKKTAAGR
jgi:cytochrome c-type biogenesis protein CcmE